MAKGPTNLIATLFIFVGVIIVVIGAISNLAVGRVRQKVSVVSYLDLQKRVQEYLILQAKDRLAFSHTMDQNPKLLLCSSACSQTDRECWKEPLACSAPPIGSAGVDDILPIEFHSNEDQIISSRDGDIYLNSELKPCSANPRPGVVAADENCQWRVEVRPFATEERKITFDFKIIHGTPNADRRVRLADLSFRVGTEQPRKFSFKRFNGTGRVDPSRDLKVSFSTDGSATVEALIRCDHPENKVAVLDVSAKDCSEQIFGPETFNTSNGKSTGNLKTLGDQPCTVNLHVQSEFAVCSVELSTTDGRFNRASVETLAGTARMENILLTVFDTTRGDDVLCQFKNGGKIDPPAAGVLQSEINLCNCPRLACFEKTGTLNVTDKDPYIEVRQSKLNSYGEMWIELRNADSSLGLSEISISRP